MMSRRRHLVSSLPVLAMLTAAGPCSEDNPVTGRCATSAAIRVERGSMSAPITNFCENGQGAPYWDRKRWELVFDVPAPISAVASVDGDPTRAVYRFAAPPEATLGVVTVDLSIQIIGSRCTGPDGATADCRVSATVAVEVVDPGTAPAFQVDIARTLGGAAVEANGYVPFESVVDLEATAQGATGAVSYTWTARRVLDGDVDPAVDGKTGARVRTSTMPLARYVYAVHARDEAGQEDDAVVVVVGQAPWPLTGIPETAVSQYPASPLQVTFRIGGGLGSVELRLEVADGSAEWSRADQDAFLLDDLAQSGAAWTTLDTVNGQPPLYEPILASVNNPLVYVAPASVSHTRGVLRVRAEGLEDTVGAIGEFAYTFVRRH